MKIRAALLYGFVSFSVPAFSWAADIPVPVAADSRIKTFVYSENDVFNVVAHYGYESNIEFSLTEEIETISVGNRAGWQIVTAGRRIFIRPTLPSVRTNMTVITSKRAYQFDLIAVPSVYPANEELAYVVRFFYPDDKKNAIPPAAYSDEVRGSHASGDSGKGKDTGGDNYSYTYTGDEKIAPTKVYDDGSSTYFKFGAAVTTPQISSVGANGTETPVTAHKQGDYWVVNTVSPQFTVHQGGATACIFNENLSLASAH